MEKAGLLRDLGDECFFILLLLLLLLFHLFDKILNTPSEYFGPV